MSNDEHDEFPGGDPSWAILGEEAPAEAPAAVAAPPAFEPAVGEPETAPEPQPESPEAGAHDESEAEEPEAERPEAEWPEHEAAETEAAETGAREPEASEPEASEPEASAPEADSIEAGAETMVEAAPPEDPFAAWPQAESAAVIEDVATDEEASVEHFAGEIDVPDGYTVLEGTPSGHRRSVAIVVARFNGGLTNRMLASAIDTLEHAGVSPDAVTIMPVPGAFELPLAAMALAKTRRYACVVALGAIVRGETPHFDYIASEAASGLQLAAIETGVPVAFGVLTCETVEQAEARIDRAGEAVRTALEMADVFAQLRASARA
jgi:6,7-dimethyl-8-ribityllumazine synthase